jgi:hypothetical protein
MQINVRIALRIDVAQLLKPMLILVSFFMS